MNKNLKVGLLSIFAIIAIVLASIFMSGSLSSSGFVDYKGQFKDIGQIKKSDKVFLNGVPIGTITDIGFQDINKPDNIIVTFNATNGLKIPKDSKVQIMSTSLMGGMGLNLVLGQSSEILPPDGTLMGVGEYGLLQKIGDNFEPLASSSDSLLKNINKLFEKEANDNVYVTLNEMNRSIVTLNKTLENVNKLVVSNQSSVNHTFSNIDKLSTTLANNQNEINQTIANIRSITSKADEIEISKTMNNLNQSISKLNTLMTELNSTNGTLGLLINDPKLYNDMNQTIESANSLMVDIKANPKRYVGFSLFGGKK